MSDLDVMLGGDGPERVPRRRARMAITTFALAVVAAMICIVLAALLLYVLGVGGAAAWEVWWDDFA